MNRIKVIIVSLFACILLSTRHSKASDTLSVIPFKMYDDLAIVQLSINGSEPLNFIFDTGTTTTLLDSVTADHIGVITDETRALLLSNDFVELPLAKVTNIKIGEYNIPQSIVIIQRSFENYNRILGFPVHGIIGEDIFEKRFTEIDFEKSEIHLHTLLDTTGFKPVKTEIYNDLFYVKAMLIATVTDSFSDRYLFDSADLSSISLSEPYWKRHDLLNKSKRYYSGVNRSSSTTTSPSYFGKLEAFSISKSRFTDFYANLTAAKRGFFANDTVAGTIGIDFIKRFNIILDLQGKQIYLKPNSLANEPFRVNTTGIRTRLNRDLSKCIIEAVLMHSPAEQAGLQTNDIILSINNIEANAQNIVSIRQLTRSKPGSKLKFKVKRGDEVKEIEVTSNEFSDN